MADLAIRSDISILNMQVFRLNERISQNPKYEEIKQSIKVVGIQKPLHLVYHPVEKGWVLSHGGQTRLRICRELYEETGDVRYEFPPVIIENYVSDLQLCFGHMIENNVRGETTFFEKCIALNNVSELMRERDGDSPAQDALAEEMENNGMRVRRQSITAMLYVAKVLKPKITNSNFIASLSRKTVDAIRSIRQGLDGEEKQDEFDNELAHFINAHDEAVSVKQIKDHFLEQAEQGVQQYVMTLARTSDLEDLIFEESELSSGYLVKLKEGQYSRHQAVMTYTLVVMSGLLGEEWDIEIAHRMGVEIPSGDCDQKEFIEILSDRLGLSELDIFGGLYSVSLGLDDRSFNTVVNLLKSVRAAASLLEEK